MSNIFGVSIQDVYVGKHLQYKKDGILVDLLPIKKSRPGVGFSYEVIEQQVKTIKEFIDRDGFRPDFVLGHFIHPSLELVVKLKEHYNAIGTVALHGPENVFSEIDARLFKKLDMVGFRSFPIKQSFDKTYGERSCYMCPSGVPKEFVTQSRKFDNGISNFIYVGTFMKRKYASCLVPAIVNAYKEDRYTITFVGDGDDKKQIISKAKEHNCMDRIRFTGRIPREEIFRHLDKSDVFIMISKIETFGLVYLEAMARGCIVVASKNEGMDGIIEHGKNGFLCTAGDEKELQLIIEQIKGMIPSQLESMSIESIKTAKQFTDSNVARDYIKAIDIN
jgi:glycosyltransferase involved in cell wall biosynthesis